MRFAMARIREVRDHLSRLGLETCPVCGGTLGVSPHPVYLPHGGWPHEKSDPRHDPEASMTFAVRVECTMCGHILLFNVEQFFTGDEPILLPPGLPDPTE